ncbi:MAG: C2H2-type zinc finger protein [Candidatus Odinarchaeota archaeon]
MKDNHVLRKCPQCGATLQSWQLLKRHLQAIHYQDFYCDSCRQCFKDQQALSQHVQNKHLFFCKTCKRSFKGQQGLNQHAKAKHGGDQQQPAVFEIVKSRPVSRAEPRTVIYDPDVDPEEFIEERKRKMRELREMERDR